MAGMEVILFFLLVVDSAQVLAADTSLLINQPTLSWSQDEVDSTAAACPQTEPLTCGSSSSCPPGLFCEDGLCECGVSYPQSNILICNGTGTLLLDPYCATYDEVSDLVLVGACTYEHKYVTKDSYDVYFPLSNNVHNLTDYMCKYLGRTGTLCGRCLPDHYPLVYSYNMTCVQCPHKRLNWLKYTAAAYLPLTLFYFVILFFNIKLVSARFYGVVYCCQIMSSPCVLRLFLDGISLHNSAVSTTLAKLLASLYGIWNLDFFRPFYSELCLGLGVLPTLALDYVVAMYPLFLMLITYLLILLYDKNYRIVITMWRPFRSLFFFFKKKWDIRTSIIDVLTSFFFLSNIKFINVSFDFLIPTRVYQLHRNSSVSTLGLYYTGDIEYFGSEHLPYAVLALIMLLVFFLLPVSIFALYPFAFFQKFLNLFPFRWYVLHTFMDSFLGDYKNGMEPGTHDCRWFASMLLLFRLYMYAIYSVTITDICMLVCTLSCLLLVALTMIVQPFKSSVAIYNTITTLLLLFLACCFFIISGADLVTFKLHQQPNFFYGIGSVFVLVPLVFGSGIVAHWVFKERKFGYSLFIKVRAWNKGYVHLEEDNDFLDDMRVPEDDLKSF